MYVIIYGVLKEADGELSIDGPIYHGYNENLDDAEIQARELANTKTKNQIIPWTFELQDNETIPELMMRVQSGWFQRFRSRTMETYETIQRDQEKSTCPFVDVSIEKFVKNHVMGETYER